MSNIGERVRVISNGGVSTCPKCGSKVESPPEVGTVINKSNIGVEVQWDSDYQCACCGHEYDRSWIYDTGKGPKLPEPVCSTIQKQKRVGGTIINTDGRDKIVNEKKV